eukprot:7874616-Prorocentrum_lima.AAC.1
MGHGEICYKTVAANGSPGMDAGYTCHQHDSGISHPPAVSWRTPSTTTRYPIPAPAPTAHALQPLSP